MARELGISRPYLYQLADGSREPSFELALLIEERTGGKVPVTGWPRFSRLKGASQ